MKEQEKLKLDIWFRTKKIFRVSKLKESCVSISLLEKNIYWSIFPIIYDYHYVYTFFY